MNKKIRLRQKKKEKDRIARIEKRMSECMSRCIGALNQAVMSLNTINESLTRIYKFAREDKSKSKYWLSSKDSKLSSEYCINSDKHLSDLCRFGIKDNLAFQPDDIVII